METRYHAFLDESGQREYGDNTDRFFVVAGAIVRCEHIDIYETEIQGIKRSFFGTPDVEVKSNWLRIPKERRKRYREPYVVSEQRIKSFVDALYNWILASRTTFIAGVVDKLQMRERYVHPHNPSGVGYHIFLQRYQKFLASRHSAGDVTFDEFTGTTKAKNEWRELLIKQHSSLKTNGCRYTRTTFDNVGDTITFTNSADNSLLQLADLAAYNTFRQFRTYGRQWDKPNAETLALYSYFTRLLPRFHKDPHNVFAGYGVAKMPRKAYNRWVMPKINKKCSNEPFQQTRAHNAGSSS